MKLRQAWVKKDEGEAQGGRPSAPPVETAAAADAATGEEVATPVVNLSLVTAGSEDVIMGISVKEESTEPATESLAEAEGASGAATLRHIDYDAEEREADQALDEVEVKVPETWGNAVDTRPDLAIGNPWIGDWKLDLVDSHKKRTKHPGAVRMKLGGRTCGAPRIGATSSRTIQIWRKSG